MTGDFAPDDMAEVIRQGDLRSLFAALLGKPEPQPETSVEDEAPGYHVARPGAWPCGTAPSGPPRHCPACTPTGHHAPAPARDTTHRQEPAA